MTITPNGCLKGWITTIVLFFVMFLLAGGDFSKSSVLLSVFLIIDILVGLVLGFACMVYAGVWLLKQEWFQGIVLYLGIFIGLPVLAVWLESSDQPKQVAQPSTQQVAASPPTAQEIKEFRENILCPSLANDDDLDCDGFDTQEDAQGVYEMFYDCFYYDYHGLDRDNDGYACESLD